MRPGELAAQAVERREQGLAERGAAEASLAVVGLLVFVPWKIG
jgi:hypothetical protein